MVKAIIDYESSERTRCCSTTTNNRSQQLFLMLMLIVMMIMVIMIIVMIKMIAMIVVITMVVIIMMTMIIVPIAMTIMMIVIIVMIVIVLMVMIIVEALVKIMMIVMMEVLLKEYNFLVLPLMVEVDGNGAIVWEYNLELHLKGFESCKSLLYCLFPPKTKSQSALYWLVTSNGRNRLIQFQCERNIENFESHVNFNHCQQENREPQSRRIIPRY